MKRECFTPSKQWACAELFSASFEQKFTVIRNLLRLSFKPRRLTLRKDELPMTFYFPMESPAGQTKDEKQANNALRTTGDMNESLRTPKRSNAQDNNDITKQSLNSISSVKLRGHFRKFL